MIAQSNTPIYISDPGKLSYSFKRGRKGYQICQDGTLLPALHWHCDGQNDCQDNTDEIGCEGKQFASINKV